MRPSALQEQTRRPRFGRTCCRPWSLGADDFVSRRKLDWPRGSAIACARARPHSDHAAGPVLEPNRDRGRARPCGGTAVDASSSAASRIVCDRRRGRASPRACAPCEHA
eukprot:Amastigsp_a522863_9.p3 type:complete len:109 gc:universal Amastigsp_a522863_9:753-427(-)